jgi:protein arginine N-methyltransferase 1
MFPTDEPLSLLAGLGCTVSAAGDVIITTGEGARTYPSQALEILAAARLPRTARELIAEVGAKASGAIAWIETTGLVASLYGHGALVAADVAHRRSEPRSAAPMGRDIELHIKLLDDEARTRAFIDAIERSVRPGDVVVDLGTGNAVLAMAAARAGAARVYAIEASPFADVAERIIAANGYADRIRVVRGWSHQIELPERADVLVSEIIGNDPLDEGVLRYMPDAVARFLKPGGRVLPARLAVDLRLIEMPPAIAREFRVGGDRVARWSARYGFDYAPFDAHAATTPRRVYRRADELAGWRVLSATHRLLDTELTSSLAAENTTTIDIEAFAASATAALLLWATIELPGASGSMPFVCGGHWRMPVTLLPAHSSARSWVITATWGPLRSGIELDVKHSG